MEKELNTLNGLTEGEWWGPFQIATTWAKQNLGRWLQSETLEQVGARMVAQLDPMTEREDGMRPGSPPSPPPPTPVTEKQNTNPHKKREHRTKKRRGWLGWGPGLLSSSYWKHRPTLHYWFGSWKKSTHPTGLTQPPWLWRLGDGHPHRRET